MDIFIFVAFICWGRKVTAEHTLNKDTPLRCEEALQLFIQVQTCLIKLQIFWVIILFFVGNSYILKSIRSFFLDEFSSFIYLQIDF